MWTRGVFHGSHFHLPGFCFGIFLNHNIQTGCLKWWLIVLVIAADSALPGHPAVGLVKVVSQLRPVVVKFVNCYLFYYQSFWDHCAVVVPCNSFETCLINLLQSFVGFSVNFGTKPMESAMYFGGIRISGESGSNWMVIGVTEP